MTSDFEASVATWMQSLPVSAEAIATMRAIELPMRETRRWWPRFAPIVATAAVLVIGAILVISSTTILRAPVAAAPPDPRAFAGDSRLARCVNGGPDPLAAFEMAHASDYRLHLPAMGLSPELDRPDPAFVVVLGEGTPRGGGGAPGAAGGFVPTTAPGAEISGRNVHDVCVLVGADAATAERTLYTDVDITGLRAFIPAVPSPAATNSPSPSTPTAAEPCRAGDLSATEEDRGSALGNGGAIIRISNAGDTPCRVSGYPELVLIDDAGKRLHVELTHATDGDYLFPAIPVTDIVLGPDETAAIQIGYPTISASNGPPDVACPSASRIDVTLPGLADPVIAHGDLSPCDGKLNVSAIHAGGDWIGFSGPEPDNPSANLTDMAWFDRQHGLFVGGSSPDGATGGTVWRTSDGGRTWQSVSVPAGTLNVVTVSGDVAWVGTTCALPAPCKNGLFSSDDHGATWTRIGFQPVGSLAFGDATHGWAIAFPDINDPSLIVSNDGGKTWSPTPSPCPQGTGVPVAVSFPSLDRGWLACNETYGAGNATKAILRTSDGEHWEVMASTPSPDAGQRVGQIDVSGYLTGLAMRPNGSGMYWADRGVSERTADGGTTWTGMSATSFDVVIPAFGWAIDDQEWLLYVWNGDLGRNVLEESTDGGATWAEPAGFAMPS